MDKITLKSHRYWSMIWIIFFIILIYYERHYSRPVAQNVIDSAIISWSAVSLSFLIRLVRNDRGVDGKFVSVLIRKISPPFLVLIFIELVMLLIARDRAEFMIILICSVASVATIYLALASLLEFSIWFNQPGNKR